jgi:hypothetical protein
MDAYLCYCIIINVYCSVFPFPSQYHENSILHIFAPHFALAQYVCPSFYLITHKILIKCTKLDVFNAHFLLSNLMLFSHVSIWWYKFYNNFSYNSLLLIIFGSQDIKFLTESICVSLKHALLEISYSLANKNIN